MRSGGGLLSLVPGVIVVFLVAALPVIAAGPVEYQVVSLDVNGDPATYRDYGAAYASAQVFAPYSLSSDGSSVAYVKRNGSPTDPGYVPMTADEFCNDNGGCRDIYVQELATGQTVSVTDRIEWSGDPLGGPLTGFGTGRWAVSADHTKFVQLWGCFSETFGDGTVCDGLSNANPVVWVDITTGETLVLNLRSDGLLAEDLSGYNSPFLSMSADGDTVVFFSTDEELAPGGQQCLLWDCFDSFGSGVYVWERGQGVKWITDASAIFPSNGNGNLELGFRPSVSGDGRYVFFSINALDFNEADPIRQYYSFVVRYDLETGTSVLVATAPRGTNFGNVAANHDGSRVVVSDFALTFEGAEGMWLIDVPTGELSFVAELGIFCSDISITPDGTAAACDRNNVGPPVIVDLSTGELHDFATTADGFGEAGYEGPYIGPDGNTAVWAGQRSSDPDYVFGAMQVRVATLTESPGNTFSDDDGSIFENDIEWLAAQEITFGCNPPTNDMFCPNDPVTRGQMASFLARALDLPAVAGNRFTDVSGTHLANINALAEAGVTLGCNAAGTLYCPGDPVTRAQMGSFLARALMLTPIPGDVFDDVTGPHEANINAIADAGITLGCNSDGTLYCPNDPVTRGQMAAFLHRALG